MAYLQFTQKALKALGLKPVEIDASEDNIPGSLGSWHVNLLYIERKKCLLFVNNKVLISFFIAGVQKSDGTRIKELFQEHLAKLLIMLEIESSKVFKVLSEYNDLEITKTSNRSVLGTLNDLGFILKSSIELHEGLQFCDLDRTTLRLNEANSNC